MLGQLITGASGLLKGAKLLTVPGLRLFVIVPIAINILLFTVSIWVLVAQFSPMVDGWIAQLPEWLAWLEWLFWLLFSVTALVVVFYTFTLLANLIASPFNGLLAEAVEKHLTGQPLPPGSSMLKALKEAPLAILDELRKWGYFALLAIPLLIISFIPVINLIAPLLWALFSAWMLALEYNDYPMGNHEIRFSDQRVRLRRNRWLGLGFGGATLIGTMIPVVNFLVMPAAVAGATTLWVEQYKALEQQGI